MSRSLLILVVTVIVVAASYYGFSRFASTSGPAVSATSPSLAQATDAMSGAAAVGNATPRASATPATSPPATSSDNPPSAAAAVATPPASGTQQPGTFSIVISKAHPPAPSDVIRVHKDDQVTLSITSDRAGHLEVHGYRKEVQLAPGTTITMSFAAARTGRFPIDLHGSDGAHVEVTALEVLPR